MKQSEEYAQPLRRSSGDGMYTRKGLLIPDEAKTNSAAMSAWIDSNQGTKRRNSGRKSAYKPPMQWAYRKQDL